MEADHAPVEFAHDDDAVLWAVLEDTAAGALVVRVDGAPRIQPLEPYLCTKGDWRRSGRPGWPIAASLGEAGSWQLYVSGDVHPWMVTVDGATRRVSRPASTLPRDLIEVLSWRLAAELARRHCGRLWVAHTIPITGVIYDCLTLWRPGQNGEIGPPIFQLNRNGTIQVHHRFDDTPLDPPRWEWHDYLTADPYQFVRTLEQIAGLPDVVSVPATTSTTLVWRLLAALLTHGIRSRRRLQAVSGFDDVADWPEPNNDLFDTFPEAQDQLRQPHPDDPLGTPHRRFWFVTVDEEPRLCLSTHGMAWLRDGTKTDLMAAYNRGDRRLGPVIARLVPPVLD